MPAINLYKQDIVCDLFLLKIFENIDSQILENSKLATKLYFNLNYYNLNFDSNNALINVHKFLGSSVSGVLSINDEQFNFTGILFPNELNTITCNGNFKIDNDDSILNKYGKCEFNLNVSDIDNIFINNNYLCSNEIRVSNVKCTHPELRRI